MKRKLFTNKRALLLVALLLLIATAVVVFGGCRKAETLPAPQNLSFEERLLSWDAVEGAVGYTVFVNDKEYETEETSFAVIDITAGLYELSVMAIGDGQDFNNSPLTESISYTLAEGVQEGHDEIGWYYTMLEDGTGYEVSSHKEKMTAAMLNAPHLRGDIKYPDFFCDYPVKSVITRGYSEGLIPIPETGADCNVVTTGVEFPKYVQRIGRYLCWLYIKLDNVCIPDNITEIEGATFRECRSLKKIKLPNSLKKIDDAAFYNTALESIVFPETLEKIDARVFMCDYPDETINTGEIHVESQLSSVTLPASIKEVGWSAFRGRENLAEIKILSPELNFFDGRVFAETKWWENQPDGLVYLREDILYGYKGDAATGTEITVPKEVKYVAGEAFYQTSNITKIVFQEGQELMGQLICGHSYDLEEVILPPDLTVLPEYFFSGSKKLTTATLPSGIKKLENGVFNNCNSLKIALPEGLESIGEVAFGSYKYEEMTLPDTVTTVEYYAFRYSAIVSIVLPKSLNVIRSNVFANCTRLKYVFYKGTAEDWQNKEDTADFVNKYSSLIYYYSQTEPTEVGNYWRYVDGVATVWDSTVSATEKLEEPTHTYTYEQQTIWFKED